MKRLVRCFVAAAILAGALWLNQSVLWVYTGVRLACNSEHVRVMHWTDGGYDSWGFDYSRGHQFDGTHWRNLWHWPTWHRARWRSTSNAQGDSLPPRKENHGH